MSQQNDWKLKGRAGSFHVWHAGKNLYYVTDGANGPTVGQEQHFGKAWSLADRKHLVAAAKELNKIEFVQIR